MVNTGPSASSSSVASTKAASTSPAPPSPEVAGIPTDSMAFSSRCLVEMGMNKLRLLQRLMPIPPACAVARNSPVDDMAKATHVLDTRKMSTKCAVGRSHTRTTESIEAAIIQRPSFEKMKSLTWPTHPQNSRTSFLVSRSITRIERSSHLKATSSLALL